MSAQEVNDFFQESVYGFILADIEREIALTKSGLQVEGPGRTYQGGGNYLCALGLLCYTEFMGAIYLGTFEKPSHELFNAFFHLMGPNYKVFDEELGKHPSLRDPKKSLSVYEVFRCGLVHEYFIKKSGVIAMLGGEMAIDQGIGILGDGRYFFVVEQYYRDFANACRRVHVEILSRPEPSIPKA